MAERHATKRPYMFIKSVKYLFCADIANPPFSRIYVPQLIIIVNFRINDTRHNGRGALALRWMVFVNGENVSLICHFTICVLQLIIISLLQEILSLNFSIWEFYPF